MTPGPAHAHGLDPVSAAQHRAVRTHSTPEPEQIDAGLWSLAMPMPGRGLRYTLSVVHIAPREVTIVDPGWEMPGSLERIERLLAPHGRRLEDITAIVVSHAHPDHIGLAGTLREASGAPVMMHRREVESMTAAAHQPFSERMDALTRWGVPADAIATLQTFAARADADTDAAPVADVLLGDGDPLPVTGWRVLHTPGHTPGHIGIVDQRRQLLFSADHVLPTQFPGIGLGGPLDSDPLDDYLASLRRLEPFDAFEVVPGHGYRFRGLRTRRAAAAAHALKRAREVAGVVGDEPGISTWDLASRLTWKGGWAGLADSFALYSAVLQTDMYRDFVARDGIARHTDE